MPGFLTLQSVEDVLAHMRSFPPTRVETTPLESAVNRHLAQDFVAPEDLPGFDRSSVDGYAVNARDVFGASEGSPALLRVVGHCPMGVVPDRAIAPGETMTILTGGMLPKGADCAVMLEYARPTGTDLVELTRPQAPWDHVIRHDDDAAKGELLLHRGQRLRPQDLGILAAYGIVTPQVFARPRVALLSTGDEVIPCDLAPSPGQVRNVNSTTIGALCQLAGAEVTQGGIVGDEPELLRAAMTRLVEGHDVIVVSGGSSAGMRDHTVELFTSLPGAQLLTHGVAISPGKPFILASAVVNGRQLALVGLPGHVTSALVCAHALLRPLLLHMQGATIPARPMQVQARLGRSIASAQGRRDYVRVRLAPVQGGKDLPCMFEAQPLPGASGCISGLTRADGLLVCPETREGYDAGDIVPVELPWPMEQH